MWQLCDTARALLITEVTSNNCQFLEDPGEAQHFRGNGANPMVE
jgi:hypothetical protein